MLGRIGLKILQLNLRYKDSTFEWGDIAVPMRSKGHWNTDRVSETLFKIKRQIQDAAYDVTFLPDLTRQQIHLEELQHDSLLQVLTEYKTIFEGKKGEWPEKLVEIELLPEAKPFS